MVKNPPANVGYIRDTRNPLEDQPLEDSLAWQPTPVLLSGESHGQEAWQATVHRVTLSLVCELSKTNIKQKQTQIGRKKWVVVIVEGRDVGKIGEGDTEVQTSSCKVNKP